MSKKESIIKLGVNYLEEFNSTKANTSHPMVYSSALGIFMLCNMLLFFSYFNIYIVPGIGIFPSIENSNFRFPGYLVLSIFFIIIFLFSAFKLSTQGNKLPFFKALLIFLKFSSHNHHILWKEFWIEKDKGNQFIIFLKNVNIDNKDFNSESFGLFYQNFINSNVEDISYPDFERLINFMYEEHCRDNKNNCLSKTKSALFLDGSEEKSIQSHKFSKMAFSSVFIFEYSRNSLFIQLPETLIRIINAIPFAILFLYFYFFLTSLVSSKTPEFEKQILLFHVFLNISLFFAIVYSIFSFWFLRRTEEWRTFWKANGLDFLLQFHSQGSNKVPPFFMPDTTFYNPQDYYIIFDACRELPLSSLYDDKRHMFFDNSQYQFVKLFSILYNSYNINSLKKEITLKDNSAHKKIKKHPSF